MQLSIIIVSYNTKEVTLACLESILRCLNSVEGLKEKVEIIVIDNASTDDSVHSIKKYLANEEVTHSVLGNIVNLGFAGANNQGILQAKGQFVWLLNSDTIVGKHAIPNLLAQMEKAGNAIIAASLWNMDKSYQPQGGDLPGFWSLLSFALLLDDIPLLGKLLPSLQHTGHRASPLNRSLTQKGWVAGTALCFPAELATEVGVLDEAIFMYAEDIDFCWRAKKAGAPSFIAKDAKVIHLGSASSSSAKARVGEFNSLAYVVRKHQNSQMAKMSILLLVIAATTRKWLYTLLGKKELSETYAEILQLDSLR